jgi:hypothetical protein
MRERQNFFDGGLVNRSRLSVTESLARLAAVVTLPAYVLSQALKLVPRSFLRHG